MNDGLNNTEQMYYPLHRVLPCKWCDDIALGGNG